MDLFVLEVLTQYTYLIEANWNLSYDNAQGAIIKLHLNANMQGKHSFEIHVYSSQILSNHLQITHMCSRSISMVISPYC